MTAAIGIFAASFVASIGVALVWYALRCSDREHEVVRWSEAADRIMRFSKALSAQAAAVRAVGVGLEDLGAAFSVGIGALAPSMNEFAEAMRRTVSAMPKLPDDWSAP